MTRLLASVANKHEAMLALEAGVDIIDLKDPREGALGALQATAIREVIELVGGRNIVSATIGDLPMQHDAVMYGVEHTFQLGVDIVKVGFFDTGDRDSCINGLAKLAAREIKIVAVLFADQIPNFGLLNTFQEAGLYGVMLDTAAKNEKGLMDYLAPGEIARFLKLAKSHHLISGLAGALQLRHIPELSSLGPDYLGFRTALCENSERKNRLSRNRLIEAQNLLLECNKNTECIGWA